MNVFMSRKVTHRMHHFSPDLSAKRAGNHENNLNGITIGSQITGFSYCVPLIPCLMTLNFLCILICPTLVKGSTTLSELQFHCDFDSSRSVKSMKRSVIEG